MRIWPWNWKSNIYSQLQLQVHIFIFMSCLKFWEWKKYMHMVLGCKRIHKPGRIFSGFSWSYEGPKSNLHPSTEISSMASLTPKLSIECSECLKIILSNFWCFTSFIFSAIEPVKEAKSEISFKFSIGPSHLISEIATCHVCTLIKRVRAQCHIFLVSSGWVAAVR